MFPAVFVTAMKTEAIGAPEIAQLPLAAVVITTGSWWGNGANWDGSWQGWWWSAPWGCAVARYSLFLQFLFLNPGEHRCASNDVR